MKKLLALIFFGSYFLSVLYFISKYDFTVFPGYIQFILFIVIFIPGLWITNLIAFGK